MIFLIESIVACALFTLFVFMMSNIRAASSTKYFRLYGILPFTITSE